MKLLGSLLCALIFVFAADTAQAGKICFGAYDTIKFVQKTELTSPEGDSLFLARHLRSDCFVAPYTVSDQGYVLGVSGKDSYYELTEEQIASFQAQGQLPTPLPAFEMTMIDLAFGHLLWLVIAGFGGWFLLSWLWKRLRSA